MTTDEEQGAVTGPVLAQRLNQLFAEFPGDHGPRSNDEVAAAITAAGTKISSSYLWTLRVGKRSNPGHHHLKAIANYFQVPVGYFFDDALAEQIAAELALMHAIRRAGVRNLALRAATLSPDSLRAVTALVERIRHLEDQLSGHADQQQNE